MLKNLFAQTVLLPVYIHILHHIVPGQPAADSFSYVELEVHTRKINKWKLSVQHFQHLVFSMAAVTPLPASCCRTTFS